MERSISQKNGIRAERIFKYKMPAEWVIRSQKEEDFGIDYEIELLGKECSNGVIFKGQLKGTDDLRKIDNESKVGYSLKSASLKYYLYEIKIPTILFVCDICEEKIYWLRITGNKEIENIYNESIIKNKQESATIYLSIKNEIKSTEKELLIEVEKAQNFLNIKGVEKLSNSTYLNMLRNDDIDRNAQKRSLKRQMEILEAQELEDEIKKLKFPEQIKMIDKVLDKKPSGDIYFSLLRMKEWVITVNSNELDKQKNRSEVILEIKKMTKKAPYQFKAYGIINKLIFEIEFVINSYISNEMNKNRINEEMFNLEKVFFITRLVRFSKKIGINPKML